VFIIFFIGSVAETNRAPFDLAEAESELVSGFMTEHAAVIFVFFFLAEYASILLICILNTMLFFAGYSLDFTYILYIFNYLFYGLNHIFTFDPLFSIAEIEKEVFDFLSFPFIEGMINGLTIGIKSCIMVFVFI
jgi:NADH-ubiquinone oxidoreductase chain 1